MKTVQLDVSGMSCGHCVATVRSALVGVAGVRQVEVSLDERRAIVVVDDAVEQKQLVSAVEQAGYGAVPAAR